ncbi:hypothetical protein [Pinibacter soli]|uniref:Outer membrane protein beta-barrel domain-containing protein n=1 Tax=Pinibacter soli TaxID=3044211 RepID=A0ABT6RG46_9BACT|nr:hypothetical protein [Pinibacter soli]MDI3321544.1 hypothetical protein [Pinibacter soli]
MKGYFLFLGVLLCCVSGIQAQKKKQLYYAERSKFILSLEAGGLIPLHGFSNQDPFLKNATNIDKGGGFFPLTRVAYFLSKKWGAEFEFLPWILNPANTGQAQQYLSNQYLSKYYVNASSPMNSPDALVVSFMIGPIYKITSGRFMIVPKLLFGINSYDGMMANYSLHLKEKNGNEIIDKMYNWNQDESTQVGWVFSPACTFSYRLLRRLGINVSANYLFCPSVRIAYTTTEQNYKLQQQTSQTYVFESSLQNVTVGAGISFLLK